MGLLSPLYLLGLAALSLPIIFHLVRRTPKGRQEFSSLMFLQPTPPILTRRSRLDQILLLLLRLAALALLAFAFARPYLRESAILPFDALPGRRLAILVDTSASMRRGDLAQQARTAAAKVLEDLGPDDEVSLYAFSDRCRRIVGPDDIEASAGLNLAAIVKSRLSELEPDWMAGDLGNALVAIAGELDSSTDVEKSAIDPEIIVITDAQQGNRMEALQAFEWPPRVRVTVTPVTVPAASNASVSLLQSAEDAPTADPRVRIASAADSQREEFRVRWGSAGLLTQDAAVSAYVPPGQSRVVRLPRPDGALAADRIVLEGDDHDFDNTFFVAPPRREKLTLLYVGDDDPGDADGQRYYLELATDGDALRDVRIVKAAAATDFVQTEARLLVVNGAVPDDARSAVEAFAAAGGIVLTAPAARDAAAAALEQFPGLRLGAAETRRDGTFSLLGQIELAHPLFVAFANPRYSDFTKIHFWNRWPLETSDDSELRVIARFDDGRPALVERVVGKGRLMILAASWRPNDSQLALSSKFVPLIGSLLTMAYGHSGNLAGVTVGEPIALPEWRGSRASAVILPDGERREVAADAAEFRDTSQPGIYRLVYGVEELPCAVNIAPGESNTAPMDVAQLGQLGVRLGAEKTRVERAAAIRQQRDTELEARQKLWRWGIIGLLGVLILETWWGGVRSRSQLASVEVAT